MDACGLSGAVPTTQQLLDMLRDARELGDAKFELAVLEQLGLDAQYIRRVPAPRHSAATYTAVDAIEMRMRSWANLIVDNTAAFPVDGE